MKKKILILSIIFSLFGIFFLGLLLHEGIHVYQSKSPQDICYSLGTNKWMFVSHNNYEEKEFDSYTTYSEKWAELSQIIFIMFFAFVLGIVIKCIWNKE